MVRQNPLCLPRSCRGLWVCDSWVSALLSQGPFLALMSPKRVWGSGPCTQQQADQWRFTFHSGPLAGREADRITPSPEMQQAGCLLVSVGLWPFCLLGTVVETGSGNGSGLLSSGEVVMEGDPGMEGREPHPLFWSTGSSDAVYLLSCHHIPHLDPGNRRVITPPMTDPVMESALRNVFLCDCYILLSHSSS